MRKNIYNKKFVLNLIFITPIIYFAILLIVKDPSLPLIAHKIVYKVTGFAMMALLLFITSISISKKLKQYLGSFSKLAGLYMFFYAVIHGLDWLFLAYGHKFVKMPYVIISGIIPFIIYLFMTLTSTPKLFKKYKTFHLFTYLATLLVVWHYISIGTHVFKSVLFYILTVPLLMLTASRVFSRYKKYKGESKEIDNKKILILSFLVVAILYLLTYIYYINSDKYKNRKKHSKNRGHKTTLHIKNIKLIRNHIVVKKPQNRQIVTKNIKKLGFNKKKTIKRVKKENKQQDRVIASSNSKSELKSNTSSSKLNKYIRDIKLKIEKNKVYPVSAKRDGVKDSILVSFKVLKSGYIESINILEYRYALLKRAVIALLHDIEFFSKFPSSLDKDSLSITVKINYNILKQ